MSMTTMGSMGARKVPSRSRTSASRTNSTTHNLLNSGDDYCILDMGFVSAYMVGAVDIRKQVAVSRHQSKISLADYVWPAYFRK